MSRGAANAGGGGSAAKYTVTNDGFNTFYPTEAYPGQYVLTTTGSYKGTPLVYDESETYLISNTRAVSTVDELPPKAREILENIPTTLAPPVGSSGYVYFVMPEENVKIVTGQ